MTATAVVLGDGDGEIVAMMAVSVRVEPLPEDGRDTVCQSGSDAGTAMGNSDHDNAIRQSAANGRTGS